MQRPEWGTIRGFISTLRRFFPHRFDTGPIADARELERFVESRAAYIAQTSLYGYLKTRMGTRYTELFQDEVFVVSINQAKWEVYGACLSDLTTFCVSYCSREGSLEAGQSAGWAQSLFLDIVNRAFNEDAAVEAAQAARSAFQSRIDFVDWATAGEGENAFTRSPAELVRAAPVTEQFKEEDREIIMNSIRFRWRDVREQFRKRAEPQAIVDDWLARAE